MLRLRAGVPVFAALLLLAGVSPSVAQDTTYATPAHVAVVDGTAVLEREGTPDTAPLSMPLLTGDRLRTENGRVQVRFGDGSTLDLDTDTTVDIQSDAVLRLTRGRIRLTVARGADATGLARVDTPGGWVELPGAGDYRISVQGDGPAPQVELAVLRGRASLLNDDGRTDVEAGERVFARAGAAPSDPYVLNSAALDDFDRWSDDRRRSERGISAQYLPETVRSYAGDFDRYGAWQYESTYGYVWYPTIAATWRPYYSGRWVTVPSFGWTWVGSDPWAWPTHHYGRWGYSARGWFWIPGRQWGPAWVSWAYAPGYVSWCPLGYNNRAVFGFSVSYYGGHAYDPWRAWTVVPSARFGAGYVSTHVVYGGRLDAHVRSGFAVRSGGPAVRGYAVPRGQAPVYAVGGRTPLNSPGRAASGQASPAYGATGRAESPDASRAGYAQRRSSSGSYPGAAPSGTSVSRGAPGASRPADARATGNYNVRGAVPVNPGDRAPISTAPSRGYAAPRAGGAAPGTTSGQPSRQGGTRQYSAPSSSSAPSPSAVPRSSYEARTPSGTPRSSDAGRTYQAGRSYEASRGYATGRPSDAGSGGAARSYEPSRSYGVSPDTSQSRRSYGTAVTPSDRGSVSSGAAVPRSRSYDAGSAPAARSPERVAPQGYGGGADRRGSYDAGSRGSYSAPSPRSSAPSGSSRTGPSGGDGGRSRGGSESRGQASRRGGR